MKKKIDEMNWQNAFREVPDDFRDAAMKAALSVQEEEKPVRYGHSFRMRPILIAAILIVALTSVAIAADLLLGFGWLDYLKSEFGVSVSDSAGQAMQNVEPVVWEVGPVTFTAQEIISDGHIAVSTINVRMTDGSPALFTTNMDDPISSMGRGEEYARSLGVDPDSTWLDAAQQLNRPLYYVRAILDVAPEYIGEQAMEDTMLNEDGTLSMYSMVSLAPDTIHNELPAGFFLLVRQIDLTTGEEEDSWRETMEDKLPIQPMLNERTYYPQGNASIEGYDIESIHAAHYVTGAYLTISLVASPSATPDDVYAMGSLEVTDEAGLPLPDGMALQESADTSQWPHATLSIMVSVDTLPDALHISNGTDTIILK